MSANGDLLARSLRPCPPSAGADQGRGGQPSTSIKNDHVALLVLLVLACVLGAYWRTTLSMAAIWERSETFAHGFVVIPIFCYLVWRKRAELNAFQPKPFWSALLGIVGAGILWLIGELVYAASVSQFAVIAMVGFTVWFVLGTRIATSLLIPLVFLFFAVPFGEVLVPTLMDWTAQFTVSALRASGVPVYQEGNYFIIPSGAWSVVEACSGLRYLIASLMVGCLYAYLSYRSTLRRVIFIAAAVVVPIIANWLRAYMIVMIGHLSNNRLAVGVDHLIYGWIFFGIVMLLLFWMGSRWRQDDLVRAGEGTAPAAFDSAARSSLARRPMLAAAAVALAAIAVWQPLLAHLGAADDALEVHLAPVKGHAGWASTSDALSTWRPDLSGARDELDQTFIKDGQRVGLHVAFYRGQTSDAKAITSTNQLVSTSNATWKRVGRGSVEIDLDGTPSTVNTAIVQRQGDRLAVWQWYWTDGQTSSNEYRAKLDQAVSMLRGRGDSAAWVVIYADDNAGAKAGATLLQFAQEMRAPIEETLRTAAGPW